MQCSFFKGFFHAKLKIGSNSFSFFLVLLGGFCFMPVYAQQSVIHAYNRFLDIPVLDLSSDTLLYSFAGGMNNCQFNTIDLNLDGKDDLLVFDRHGNRLLPFVSQSGNAISFAFNPELSASLPEIDQWIRMADYNGDGKQDVFTYTTGGIKVFRNDSDQSLKFTQVTFPYLISQQGNTLTNILVTNVDYPAIIDVDNDGDLDIISFWGLGAFVEWHRNLSIEKFGNRDSLTFEKVSSCWGQFAEGIESNSITLDTCIGENAGTALKIIADDDPKHTGSTLLVHDLNADGLPDLTLGDVDFATLFQLTNGGTLNEAKMVSQSTDFPNSTHPVNLKSFPAAMLAEVDNDQKIDLLVSPFDPSLAKSENTKSSWFYKNIGSNEVPQYVYIADDFLQSSMLDFGSGAYPVVFDFNSDGLPDILIGNYGYYDSSVYSPIYGLQSYFHSSLALMLNVGSNEKPAFQLINNNVAGLDTLQMLSLVPAVADMDGDGDMDLVCGNSKGKFVYCENTAQVGQNANFVLKDAAWFNFDVGDFSAPNLFDIDNDGLIDLISGNKNGTLSCFKNIGTKQVASFVLISDKLGGVDVTNSQLSNYGYSVPFFCREPEGNVVLLCGSEFGDIKVYDQIEGNLVGDFRLRGDMPGIKEGWRIGVNGGNFNNDTLIDLVVGNYAGGINMFKGTSERIFGINHPSQRETNPMVAYPNPTKSEIILYRKDAYQAKSSVFRICDMKGRVVMAMNDVSFPIALDFSNFEPGVYMANYQDDKSVVVLKIIKVN